MLSVRCLSVYLSVLYVLSVLPVLSVLSVYVTFVHCVQTVGRMKTKLGMLVGLCPGHIVLDGDRTPLPQRRRSLPQILGPCLLRPNGWMDEAGTWHGGRPQPRHVSWGPSPLPPKGGGAPLHNFWPISIVAKRLHASKCHLV